MNIINMSYDKNTALHIKNFLISQGLTLEGTYGMMANIYSESGFRSNNAQNSYMTKMNMTDEIYTTQVDNGQYQNFGTDRVGYGLCQWTSSGRKTGLLNYAKSQNKSIGDETMQLNYLIVELTTAYQNVLNKLKTSHDIAECAKYVMTKFERPADQSEAAQTKRANYGLQLYQDLEEKEEIKMGYTNSPLVNYINLSPNKTSPRNHVIDTITIHCIVGQWTAKKGCDYFANPLRRASCNYVVGTDGSIGLCVEEKDRSWCTSSKSNDHRAITIEVASDLTHPYAITNAAMDALIKLCADICKRNNIDSLKWKADKSLIGKPEQQNMTVHRWFDTKSCPGEYLYNKHSYIASEVNKILGAQINETPIVTTTKTYTVVSGDTLSKIGKKTGINWKVIAELNSIKAPYIVRKGQILKLSDATIEQESVPVSASVPLKIKQSKQSIQDFLNVYYGNEIKKVNGALLTIDGAIGTKSKIALGIAIQTELNKLGAGLTIDGNIGPKSVAAWDKYVGNLKQGSKGIFVTLWQCVLVASNLNPNGIDGNFGSGCKKATNILFGKKKLAQDSAVSGSDVNTFL
jgi:LysM repeat protein